MVFIKLNPQGEVVDVADTLDGRNRSEWQSRSDWNDFSTVERLAAGATTVTGRLHIAIDNSKYVWPRYDIMEAPKVGDEVSYAFNGDYYPDGVITHVTPGTLRIIKTSNGHTYYRRKNSGRWVQTGGTWSLVGGHRNERNPHF